MSWFMGSGQDDQKVVASNWSPQGCLSDEEWGAKGDHLELVRERVNRNLRHLNKV